MTVVEKIIPEQKYIKLLLFKVNFLQITETIELTFLGKLPGSKLAKQAKFSRISNLRFKQ